MANDGDQSIFEFQVTLRIFLLLSRNFRESVALFKSHVHKAISVDHSDADERSSLKLFRVTAVNSIQCHRDSASLLYPRFSLNPGVLNEARVPVKRFKAAQISCVRRGNRTG